MLRGDSAEPGYFSIQLMDGGRTASSAEEGSQASDPNSEVSMPVATWIQRNGQSHRVSDERTICHLGCRLAPWKPATDLNVSFARLKNARQEPQNWLTYWGDYEGTHYSWLDSITPANVKTLRSEWTFQFGGSNVEVTPIVVDGLMFVTGPLNNAAALDARTGRPIWRYSRRLPDGVRSQCTVMTNRGVGILGDRLYMATLDMHLVALDAKTGNVIWDVAVMTIRRLFHHPCSAADEKSHCRGHCRRVRLDGFLDAFDATTGKKLWRFWSIPKRRPSTQYLGGRFRRLRWQPTWTTGTYDVETDTLFWPTGNPARLLRRRSGW
jgi:alcohol dehydrogenase (cytochrome c)